MLINTIALQEAKTSTEIENIFTTEDDLYKAISETTRSENVYFPLPGIWQSLPPPTF